MKPPTFYKYHRLNNHLDDLLKNQKFWLSSMEHLNDAYDLKYVFSSSYLDKMLDKASDILLQDLKKNLPISYNFPGDSFKDLLKKTVNSERWDKDFHNQVFAKGLDTRVCCFTTKPENELMWAHYGDGHKGVCLGFDFSESNLYERINQVKYSDEFPVVNSVEEIPDALLTKRKVYEYEQEWRILSMHIDSVPFETSALKSIYFGYNVQNEQIEYVQQLVLNQGYTNVNFKKLEFKLPPRSSGLQIPTI